WGDVERLGTELERLVDLTGDEDPTDEDGDIGIGKITVVILVRDRCPRGKGNLPRQTRSSSKFVGEPSTNPTSTIPKRRNRRRSKQRVDPFVLEETPIVTMADQRTMAELLRAPTEGYADAIVVPSIPAEHFELKHSLIYLVTSKQFFSFEKEDHHAHIRYFNKITSTLKYKDVP
ncbi:hypothetical protein Tco_1087325, partial [Tanacetum coccineum]